MPVIGSTVAVRDEKGGFRSVRPALHARRDNLSVTGLGDVSASRKWSVCCASRPPAGTTPTRCHAFDQRHHETSAGWKSSTRRPEPRRSRTSSRRSTRPGPSSRSDGRSRSRCLTSLDRPGFLRPPGGLRWVVGLCRRRRAYRRATTVTWVRLRLPASSQSTRWRL